MQANQQTVCDNEAITRALSDVTGLDWAPPPATPSLLHNGYYAQTDMAKAPHLVRKLKDIAISATGRSRAIVFERCGERHAAVNIPKEVAENKAFLASLIALVNQPH